MKLTLANLFSSAPPPQAAPAPAQQSGNAAVPATASPTAMNPGNIPGFEKSNTPDPAPLDRFEDLFTMNAVDPANPPTNLDAPYFTLPDDKTLMEQVASMRFLNPEVHGEMLERAAKGDVAALTNIINASAQNAYAQGAKLAARVSEEATRNGVSRVNAGMSERMRSDLARTQVSEINPIFNHPALAPMVQAARSHIEQKFPQATPGELARLTNDYMTAAADAMKTPTPIPQTSSGGNTEVKNWGDFFGARSK